MATYKEIKGTGIQNFSSDPANPINGQVWYNTTSSTLKVAEVSTTGAWATGGNLATARSGMAPAGTQTAALSAGGATPSSTNVTEEYDGSSWTAGGNMTTARKEMAGAGTQTAGLAIGGESGGTATTEEYDGSSWTNGGNMSNIRYLFS